MLPLGRSEAAEKVLPAASACRHTGVGVMVGVRVGIEVGVGKRTGERTSRCRPGQKPE